MANKIFHNDVSMFQSNKVYLERPHINHLLEGALQKPVTTIVAGAGFGKTQAVYAFLQEYDAVTIWMQLSSFDNLATRLWDNFIYAVSLQNKEFASNLMSLGFPETMSACDRFLVLLSNEITLGKKYVFVCDDLHLIHDENILQFFEKLINVRIPNLSFIFISREEPYINRTVSFSKDLDFSITEDDLRFSQNEMIHYFQMQGIQLASKAMLDIYKYTNGWILAVHLIGLSLKKGTTYEKHTLTIAKKNIFKLIENEIFSVIPKELQDFLVKITFINNIHLDLLKELCSSNPSLIAEMAKVSSFIRYDAFMNTYVIHPLFLEFLIEKQFTLKEIQIAEVHVKAADWYAKKEYRIDAITHYEKVGDYDKILSIISNYSSRCSYNTASFIASILERAPKKLIKENPIIEIIHAKFLLNNFEVEKSYIILSALRQKYEALPSTTENRAILGETYIMLGLVSFVTCFVNKKYEFKELFKMADECLPNGSAIVHKDTHLNSGNYVCWVSHRDKGEYNRFLEAISYTMPFATKVMNGSGCGYEYLARAEFAFFQNDLENAEKYAYQAINKSREHGQYDIENMAIFIMIRINLSMGDYSKILYLLEQLRSQAESLNNSDCYTFLDIAQGWFYSVMGQTQNIASWITDEVESSIVTSPVTFALDKLVRARCYLAEKKYYELIAFSDNHNDKYRPDDFLIGLIEVKILKAIALYYLNEKDEALLTLQDSYELAYPNLMIMPFIEQGKEMRTLINAALNSDDCTIPKQWLETIYEKSSTYAEKIAHISTNLTS